jgi:hypothetical protein
VEVLPGDQDVRGARRLQLRQHERHLLDGRRPPRLRLGHVQQPQGDIFKVDVTNVAICTDPGYNPGQMGLLLLRHGLRVSQGEFDNCDKLYGNTYDGQGGFGEGNNFGTS